MDVVHRNLHIVRTKTNIKKAKQRSQMEVAMRQKIFQQKGLMLPEQDTFDSKLYVIRYVDEKTKIATE
jgi:hypothetical protein